jgi:hypothetical protein
VLEEWSLSQADVVWSLFHNAAHCQAVTCKEIRSDLRLLGKRGKGGIRSPGKRPGDARTLNSTSDLDGSRQTSYSAGEHSMLRMKTPARH